jgi:hypothetical protein
MNWHAMHYSAAAGPENTGRGCFMAKKPKPEPPDWWDLSSYGYLETLPLEGWVWEFMRRARLKEILKDKPVDAMNPKPKIERGMSIAMRFYRKGLEHHWPRWSSSNPPVYVGNRARLYYEEPSLIERKPQDQFVMKQRRRRLVKIIVDLDYTNSIIRQHFDYILEQQRKKHPERKGSKPRVQQWIGNHALEVWDLKQFRVSWKDISVILGLNSVQSARNGFNTAQDYIRGKWVDLARYADSVRMEKGGLVPLT